MDWLQNIFFVSLIYCWLGIYIIFDLLFQRFKSLKDVLTSMATAVGFFYLSCLLSLIAGAFIARSPAEIKGCLNMSIIPFVFFVVVLVVIRVILNEEKKKKFSRQID